LAFFPEIIQERPSSESHMSDVDWVCGMATRTFLEKEGRISGVEKGRKDKHYLLWVIELWSWGFLPIGGGRVGKIGERSRWESTLIHHPRQKQIGREVPISIGRSDRLREVKRLGDGNIMKGLSN